MNTDETTDAPLQGESERSAAAPHLAVDSSKSPSTEMEDVFAAKIRELRTLKLFSWNIWLGGREIDDAVAKQAAVLAAEDADIVFLQESFGSAALRMGRDAGMTVAQQDYDCAVLSASPIRVLVTDTASYATAALVHTRMGDVLAWSVHLAHWDYGPYRAEELPHNASAVFAQEGERSRTAEAETILAETDRLLAELGEIPVVIAGDFNVPSSLDWNGQTRPEVAWPATEMLMDAGFTDAFRAVHPHASIAPGLTWSQIEPLEKEPRDRIDFIYVRGLEVAFADHLGGAAATSDAAIDPGFTDFGGTFGLIPDQRGNDFPSDHLAVRAAVRRPA